jgi:hypothetical protein
MYGSEYQNITLNELRTAWHICKQQLKMNSYRYQLLHVMPQNDNKQHCQFLGHIIKKMDDN